jgi:hypothetical protein
MEPKHDIRKFPNTAATRHIERKQELTIKWVKSSESKYMLDKVWNGQRPAKQLEHYMIERHALPIDCQLCPRVPRGAHSLEARTSPLERLAESSMS